MPHYDAIAPYLKQLPSDSVEAWNTLLARSHAFTVHWGEQPWHCECRPCDAEPALTGAVIYIDLLWNELPLVLQLPQSVVRLCLEQLVPQAQFQTVPAALINAALEIMLAQLMTPPSSDTHNLPLRVQQHRLEQGWQLSRTAYNWQLQIEPKPGGAVLYGLVQFSDLALRNMANTWPDMFTPTPKIRPLPCISVPIRARLGRTNISFQQLHSLQVGDVIVLDEYLVSTEGELWLDTASPLSLRVRVENSRYLITQGWTSLMSTSSTSPTDHFTPESTPDDADLERKATDHSGSEPPVAALGELPVQLSFDLGERRFTLSELQNLQVGQVFDLERPLSDGVVHIRANQLLVAYGALINIDGRVGVQISRLTTEP
ncbi:type III secretion system cytoplasmic ring protein SctQ [Alcaligenes endophyticus]|uniref:Type III secretion system cytoplasmic ring protein SctQ n=1 Tax=Alcaligenes endophyticus TaxID=1929088 RepID=A0ABT8EFK1_9BURK|nr:type III secretion system cytoplasmic ring protein SctQ [Alcaligenes endophyticus]MCX5590280.1 type III secretion system cytoplasmic ring protein SctQ [Alcaligenes endophyticus]MDN4120056.1 type III secretion system cytoplasmic ring protein SctQ [Alcaligenes endophyticus]